MTAPALKTADNFVNTIRVQTVYRDNHQKNFTILGNETLRTRIPGDKLTAKDVWIDALTCEKGWYMSKQTLAKRHGVTEKVMGGLLTRLSKNGYAKHLKMIDPKNNRIIKHQWIFYETPRQPQPQNGVYGSSDENQHEYCDNTPKSHDTQNGAVALYIDQDIKKKQHSEKITTPQSEPYPKKPPEPPSEQKAKKPPAAAVAVADIKNIRKLISPQLSFRINDTTLEKLIHLNSKHIEYAAKQAINSKVSNKVGLFIKLCREELPMAGKMDNEDYDKKYQDRLKNVVKLPANINGQSDEMRCVACYNRNIVGIGCTSMNGKQRPSQNCMLYCPHYNKSKYRL